MTAEIERVLEIYERRGANWWVLHEVVVGLGTGEVRFHGPLALTLRIDANRRGLQIQQIPTGLFYRATWKQFDLAAVALAGAEFWPGRLSSLDFRPVRRLVASAT